MGISGEGELGKTYTEGVIRGIFYYSLKRVDRVRRELTRVMGGYMVWTGLGMLWCWAFGDWALITLVMDQI